jgi:transcriptional regulator with XRE-family HTH domain
MTDYVPPDAIGFRTYLENILSKYNLSGSELARQIHVSRSTISLYRSEDRLPITERGALIINKITKFLVSNGEGDFNFIIRDILYSVHVSQMRKLERS